MLFRSDRKSTRLNSSHTIISYAVFCLKKKKPESSDPTPHLGHPATAGMSRYRHGCAHGREGAVAEMTHVFRDGLFSTLFFFFNDRATTRLYPLPQHDALPI